MAPINVEADVFNPPDPIESVIWFNAPTTSESCLPVMVAKSPMSSANSFVLFTHCVMVSEILTCTLAIIASPLFYLKGF